jgi:hypothetical protein
MAPNFCAHCGEKVLPEQRYCPNCGTMRTTVSANIVTNDSVQHYAALSSTARPRAYSAAFKLGVVGGVLGVVIGILFIVLVLDNFLLYYAGYVYQDLGPVILLQFLTTLGILAFSILGALAAAQKLDARLKVNAGVLFIAGIVILPCFLFLTIAGGIPPDAFIIAGIIAFIGFVISVLFFFSGYLLVREPPKLVT